MKKLILILFLALASTAFAQTPQPNFLDRLAESFNLYNKKFPKEQVYLQLDKNYYQQGDSLWFKGYVLNQNTHRLSNRSNTLTVFLVNKYGNEILRKEFLISKGEINGVINLPEEDTENEYYKLVAFTSWMKNYNKEAVFQKDILIKSNGSSINYFKLDFGNKKYTENENGMVEVSSFRATGVPISFIRFRYEVHIGNRLISHSETRTDGQGHKSIRFDLPKKLDSLPTIKVFAVEDMSFETKYSNIPIVHQPKLDLQFFPEGGDAIANLSTKVAFKAVNVQSQPVDIKGEVLDSKENLIAKIETNTLGMGAFNFIPLANEKYKVRITEPQGYNDLVEFPQIKNDGYILSVENQNTSDITVNIKSSYKGIAKKGYLVAQMMGDLVYSNPIELTDSVSLTIPTKEFSIGIAQLTYFDENQIPQAERLVFLNKHKKVNITVENLKEKYQNREQVSLRIKATDEEGNPTRATLSMAVTDSLLGLSDNYEYENILSSMIFRPYLKGKIYQANSYFENTKNADQALDLLMLTQGWRRFDWKNFTTEKINKLQQPTNYEIVSGTVYQNYLTKKPSPKAIITITQLRKKTFNTLCTDNNGKFSFLPNFSSIETAQIVLFAKSATGKDNVTLVLNENDSLATQIPTLFPANSYDDIQRIGVKDNIEEKTIPLKDPVFDDKTKITKTITVKDSRKKNDFSGISPMYIISKKGNQFREEKIYSFLNIIEQMTTVYSKDMTTGYIQICRKSDLPMPASSLNVTFLIDGASVGWSFKNLDYLTTKEIESVRIIKDQMMAKLVCPDAEAGIIYVTTKKNIKAKVDKNVAFSKSQNYEYVREFYTPKYDTEKSKEGDGDIRTTIHWKPFIGIGDSGETTVTFYNSDIAGTAIGTIEGVSIFGGLGHCKFSYEVIRK